MIKLRLKQSHLQILISYLLRIVRKKWRENFKASKTKAIDVKKAKRQRTHTLRNWAISSLPSQIFIPLPCINRVTNRKSWPYRDPFFTVAKKSARKKLSKAVESHRKLMLSCGGVKTSVSHSWMFEKVRDFLRNCTSILRALWARS